MVDSAAQSGYHEVDMSRTKKGRKGPGHDYGSARPTKSATSAGGWPSPGPYTKRLTHRAERRVAAQVVTKALSTHDQV